MRPIPVVFHLGPLQVHTYGLGLAVTFWFAYRYLARRLRANGYPDAWLGGTFVWVVKPNRSVEVRNVTASLRVDQDMVVDQGLQPGETVVTEGQLRLAPDSHVVIRGGSGGPGRGREAEGKDGAPSQSGGAPQA